MSQDHHNIGGKATDPTTISSLISRINNIHSSSLKIQSGGHYCPYNPEHRHYHHSGCPMCPYNRQRKMELIQQQGLDNNGNIQYYYYPSYDNTIGISNNTKNSNRINNRINNRIKNRIKNRNVVSNAFINHIKTEKPINIEYMNVENNYVHKKINKNTNLNKVEYYLFEVNGKKYIGIRQLYTGKNGKKIKYLNHIKEVK